MELDAQLVQRFGGKAVVVTAAGGLGTGAALVRRFLAEGADVLASDVNVAGLEQLRDVPLAEGQQLVVQACDATVDEQVEDLIATAIRSFGKLDILCNHVGGGPMGRIVDVEPADWRTQIDTTLTSVYLVSHFALPHLIESKGCIVNTASISGLGGDLGMGGYNAAKAGVVNLTRTMAIELAADGVRVNCVAPGAILNAGSAPVFAPVQDQYLGHIPMARFATPDEIAATIAFLASPDASYVTGTCFVVDGGMSASSGQFPVVPAWEAAGVPIPSLAARRRA